MGTSLVVRSQIKQFAKVDDAPLNISGEFFDELNVKVAEMIGQACKRAKANNRNTVMGRDL